jgi:hypothetical protein
MPELTLSPLVRDYEFGYRNVCVVYVTEIVGILSSIAGNFAQIIEKGGEEMCRGSGNYTCPRWRVRE